MVTELCFQPHETIYRGLRAPDLDVLVCVLSVPVGRFYARARVCRLGLCVDIGVVSVCMCVCVCVCWYPCIQASEVHCSSEEGCVCVCVCVGSTCVFRCKKTRACVCVCVCECRPTSRADSLVHVRESGDFSLFVPAFRFHNASDDVPH